MDSTTVGNVFTVDANHDSTRLDSNAVRLTWLSNDVLKITYDKKLRTFIKNDELNKIKVVYAKF
ncbi:hypothetical protein [Mucilaginibacter polytrichastri]|uniref:Uncharacterized protein n=1 Tax=Mucilaginibacter polytrichastri TaxID=1302689 RepID=A0A1Q6A1G0_9SPHI|nr:hypothetical protein [Mucilaginibacter polytrichastri]OKS87857.1 hypothetical protein RG47T_3320 [Mucilaginibacter polytrichastri]